jgi:predicted MFS family arabinose efflux permease
VSGRALAELLALCLATFSFVTAETLPIGLLTLIAADLDRSLSAIGLLVTGYAAVVVVVSVPLTQLTRNVPRRLLLVVLLALFGATNLASALAPNYATLFGARLITAIAQALFWAVVTAVAAGLFPRKFRGRAVAAIAAGATLGPVLGVPAGTWLGQQSGWRAAFVAMTVVSVLTCSAVAVLVPSVPPGETDAARGLTPDARRYWLITVTTALAVTGYFTTFTYITAFLIDVSGWPASALGPLLFVAGLAALAGVAGVGAVLDRFPRAAIVSALLVMCAAVLGLALLGALPVVAVGCAAAGSLGFSAFAPAVTNRVMQVAPGSTDMANAGLSSAFNVGIAGGSLVGGGLVAGFGVGSVAVAGAAVTAVALGLLLGERYIPLPDR